MIAAIEEVEQQDSMQMDAVLKIQKLRKRCFMTLSRRMDELKTELICLLPLRELSTSQTLNVTKKQKKRRKKLFMRKKNPRNMKAKNLNTKLNPQNMKKEKACNWMLDSEADSSQNLRKNQKKPKSLKLSETSQKKRSRPSSRFDQRTTTVSPARRRSSTSTSSTLPWPMISLMRSLSTPCALAGHQWSR